VAAVEAVHALVGDALAVDMEGWGFQFASHMSQDAPALVIRGISDKVGNRKVDDSQHAAAEHAAAFAVELLAYRQAQ
jgi:nucleoside phosphorylase